MDGEWKEWGRHVLSELKELKADQRATSRAVQSVKVEVAGLKVKASFWGAVSGAMAAVGAWLLGQK